MLDEMYPPSLAEVLRAHGVDAFTAAELGPAGRSDSGRLATATADGYVLLTENIADLARLGGEH